jgi:hypothetical protein
MGEKPGIVGNDFMGGKKIYGMFNNISIIF